MVLFINPAKHASGVHTGTAPEASWEKHKTNLLLRNHKAQSFHILCVAMYSGPLINPANCVPGVNTDPAPGASWEKRKIKYSSPKPQGPELLHFVCSNV